MTKKGRVKVSSHHDKKSATRRKIVFAISIILIAFMLWSVLRSVAYISAVSENAKKGMDKRQERTGNAFGRKGRLCKGEGFSAFFSFCKVGSTGRGNSCAEGCVCEPFRKKGKWGICKTEGGGPGPGPVVPTATPVPGDAGASCGQQCVADDECASGYCHPAGFELCPTAEPGMPIEDCQFIPPDPTQPSVCMPVDCRTDSTKCSCQAAKGTKEPQQAAPERKYIFQF